jgi:hypothetical protein
MPRPQNQIAKLCVSGASARWMARSVAARFPGVAATVLLREFIEALVDPESTAAYRSRVGDGSGDVRSCITSITWNAALGGLLVR